MNARVAVIVPCFNDGPLATEAVESVQEVEGAEVVVIDDGSTDTETLTALERLREREIRVISRPNAGVSAARMTGVEQTSAPYVYPLDSDDQVAPGGLSALADALDRNPDAGFAYGDFEVFGDYRGRWTSPERFSLWAQTWANFIPNGSMVRRSALLEVGGWEITTGFEDWDLWLKLAEAGWGGARVPGVVYQRRMHGTRKLAASSSRRPQTLELFRRRHPQSFERRRDLARAERVPLARRLAYPVIFGIRNRNLLPYRLEQALLRWNLKRSLRRAEGAG